MSEHPSETEAASANRRIRVSIYSAPTTPRHRVQVAAARLRVTLDERLGRATPAKTKSLAKEAL
jgi:hypothetical protein